MKIGFLFVLLVLMSLASAWALEIQGKIALRGNDPHSYLTVITSDNRLYQIIGIKEKELARRQGQELLLEGQVTNPALGPGRPAQFNVIQYRLTP